MRHFFRLFLFLLTIQAGYSFAGGPLNTEGPNGNTPVTYLNPDITLHVENGDLGSRSNATAVTLLQEAFDLWNDINTSTINLSIDPSELNFEVDIDNFFNFIPIDDNSDPHEDDNRNPIIFDGNGDIIEAIFGEGQSNDVLGFSTSIFFEKSNNYLEGYAVINGKDFGFNDTKLKLLFAHEVAHMFGLDHSQNNINNQESLPGSSSPTFCTTVSTNNYPVMYPFACRNSNSLHADDISAVSALYPAASINDDYGVLSGRFLTGVGLAPIGIHNTGEAILGANIWAENDTGTVISGISDYLKQGTGFYKLYLPAGNYTLHANSINTFFTEGSSVGPYSLNSSDASFSEPHPITKVTYLGSNSPNAEVITISTNQTTSIDFSSAGEEITTNSDSNSSSGGATTPLIILLSISILIWRRRTKQTPRIQH